MNSHKINIAFADDHTLVRKSIISMLSQRREDFSFCIEACNGNDLLHQIEHTATLPDICLLDISMPEMNGFEALEHIKRSWPTIKILALSIFDSQAYIINMMRLGANGYVSKAAAPETLIEAISSIHKRGVYHSQEVTNALYQLANKNFYKVLNITEREKIFLRFCCTDMTHKEIAQKLNTTVKSVDGYRDSLFRKLGVNSRSSLVMFAIQSGIVVIDQDFMYK